MMKRAVSLYVVFTLCFMVLLGRIVYLNNSEFSDVGQNNSTRTLVVGNKRATIYDRNYVPLTNSEIDFIAVVTPVAGIEKYLSKYLTSEEIKEKINSGFPFTVKVDEQINNELIRTFSVPIRYSENQIAAHLIGYTNSEKTNGLSGIERAYNSFLTENSGSISVTFQADAKGRILSGMDKTINDNLFSSDAAVVLTIDSKVQSIAEKALSQSGIKSGCALVMHVDTGEILAMASVPTYDPDNVQQSLFEENSPLINKALQKYSVGSVFKPLVAAAALENGKSTNYEYECTGEIKVGDTVFSCYNHNSHGKINMTEALEVSCNTYFINLIMNMDTGLLLSLCNEMKFGKSDKLCENLFSQSGVIPDEESLKLKGSLANFAFGQGEILLTPVQMLKLYHVLATGNYVDVSVVRGVTDYKGVLKSESEAIPQKLLSSSTVNKLRQMLWGVVENGNGEKAKSNLVSLAGKTGTAQSGVYENKSEICRTWFAGFFPANNPHYVVVVMNENGISGSADCAPVFKKICEEMCKTQ